MEGMVRERMTEWRASGTVERISTPTKLSRARALGYKAKPGFVVAIFIRGISILYLTGEYEQEMKIVPFLIEFFIAS